MAEVGSAFVSILPSARGFGSKLDSTVGPEVDGAGKKAGARFGAALKVGAVAAIGGAAVLLKGAFGEAQEATKIGAQTAAVIKSTGGVAGVTAKHVDELATSISNKIGVDDEAIAAGQNMLLTFSKVRNEVGKGNDVFDRATVTASDMAAAFGGDAVSNSKMLGKALNDPIRGVSALTRVGVSFTQQQKDQIKALQESGNVLGAQKVILGEVEKQTAGSAEAQATSADKMGVAWGNLQEKLGVALMPAFEKVFGFVTNTGIPALESLGSAVSATAGFLNRNRTAVITLTTTLIALVAITKIHAAVMAVQAAGGIVKMTAAMLKASSVAKAWTAVQWLLNAAMSANPIGLVIIAIAALVAGFVIAWKKSETFRKVVTGALDAIAAAGRWMWNNVLQPVFRSLAEAVAKAMELFGKMLQIMGKAPGMGWVGELGDKLVAAAGKADQLADGIEKIPDRKTVSIDIFENVYRQRSGGSGFGAVPALASGGVVTRPTLALVGEGSESEAVLPLSKLSAMLATARASGGGPGGGRTAITITNWATGAGYMESIADGRIAGQFDLDDERRRAHR